MADRIFNAEHVKFAKVVPENCQGSLIFAILGLQESLALKVVTTTNRQSSTSVKYVFMIHLSRLFV